MRPTYVSYGPGHGDDTCEKTTPIIVTFQCAVLQFVPLTNIRRDMIRAARVVVSRRCVPSVVLLLSVGGGTRRRYSTRRSSIGCSIITAAAVRIQSVSVVTACVVGVNAFPMNVLRLPFKKRVHFVLRLSHGDARLGYVWLAFANVQTTLWFFFTPRDF